MVSSFQSKSACARCITRSCGGRSCESRPARALHAAGDTAFGACSARAGSVAEGACRHGPGARPHQHWLIPGLLERKAGEVGDPRGPGRVGSGPPGRGYHSCAGCCGRSRPHKRRYARTGLVRGGACLPIDPDYRRCRLCSSAASQPICRNRNDSAATQNSPYLGLTKRMHGSPMIDMSSAMVAFAGIGAVGLEGCVTRAGSASQIRLLKDCVATHGRCTIPREETCGRR
jgi:hypothetical protein